MFSITNMDRELTVQFVMMIVGILAAIWNVFVFRSAKKSEKQSKKYADQADMYYKKVIEFYNKEEEKQELEIELLEANKNNTEKREIKDKVFAYAKKNGVFKTSRCAEELGISKVKAFELLEELFKVDRLIGSGGSPDKNNVDSNIWTSNWGKR